MTTRTAKLAGLALIAALCAGFTLGLTAPGWAGLDEGVAAYKRGDYATALREWRPLAEQGHAKAQYNLGQMYRNGQGVPQDYARAAKWFRKAAEQGVAVAQYNLGFMYEHGLGVTQDYAKALQWWRKAAAQGHPKAKDYVKALDAAGVTPVPPEAGAFRIQLAAMRSATAAEAEWRRLKRRHRDLLEALRPRVQRADLGAKGVFYRLQAGPLADAGRAKGLCETLARRTVPCLVITP